MLGKDSFIYEKANKLEVAVSEKSDVDYELKKDSHEKWDNFDVVEAIEG